MPRAHGVYTYLKPALAIPSKSFDCSLLQCNFALHAIKWRPREISIYLSNHRFTYAWDFSLELLACLLCKQCALRDSDVNITQQLSINVRYMYVASSTHVGTICAMGFPIARTRRT